MYVEDKSGGLIGPARIGRVAFSKTGRTLYYAGRSFRSLEGAGFKANYYDIRNGDEFWISGPRRDGRLYGERVPVEIDADVRREYWTEVRARPDLALETVTNVDRRRGGERARSDPSPRASVARRAAR